MGRPKRITINPTALDRNGISTAQSPGAGGNFTIDGLLATTQSLDRNGIAAAQTPAAAGALTLNGAAGLAYPSGTPVTIYAGADESGVTFTVVGYDRAKQRIEEVITGPNTTTVSGTTVFYGIEYVYASAATSGDVEVGIPGIATFTTPQHITAFAAGDESGDTITVYGEDRWGRPITGTITGVNNTTVATTANFSRVYNVTTSGAVTNMEIGVDGTCESGWVPINYYNFTNVALGVDVTSTITYTIQHTFEDVFASTFTENGATTFNHDTLAAQTTDGDGNYSSPPSAVRLAVTAHTDGSAVFTVIESN